VSFYFLPCSLQSAFCHQGTTVSCLKCIILKVWPWTFFSRYKFKLLTYFICIKIVLNLRCLAQSFICSGCDISFSLFLFVQSADPVDKDAWKDRGTGQLSIKCKEGVSKGTRESKPTILIRNDVSSIPFVASSAPLTPSKINKL